MKLKKIENVARFSALHEFMKNVDSTTLQSTKFSVDFTNSHDVGFAGTNSPVKKLALPLFSTPMPAEMEMETATPKPAPTIARTTTPATLLAVSIPLMIMNYTETVYEAPVTKNLTSSAMPTIFSGYAIPHTDHLSVGSGLQRYEHAPNLSTAAMIKVYVLSVMALLSLFGNIMTMWNIYKTRLVSRSTRHNWTAIYSLIFHLSIADVLVTVFCIIGEAAWCYTVQWIADELTCKLVKLFQMFSLYLSTYVLVLIGVDRWIAVRYPMRLLNMTKLCYRLLGGIYILSLLLSLPQFFIFHISRGPFVEEFYQCVTHGFYTAKWQEQLYATFTLVFTFLLPLCILFATYLSSFRVIANSEKMFQGSKLSTYNNKHSAQTNRQRLIHKAKMKTLRISVVIVFAFLICWTPYYVMMIIFMFWNPDKRFAEDLQSAIFFFGMSNSLVNPLIYGAFHLCPMHRKAIRYGRRNHLKNLNRGDSQRTNSIPTAVTQVDNPERIGRPTARPNYYRTPSNGSNSVNFDHHHINLAEVAPKPMAVRKCTESPFHSNARTIDDSDAHPSTVIANNVATRRESLALLRTQRTMPKKIPHER